MAGEPATPWIVTVRVGFERAAARPCPQAGHYVAVFVARTGAAIGHLVNVPIDALRMTLGALTSWWMWNVPRNHPMTLTGTFSRSYGGSRRRGRVAPAREGCAGAGRSRRRRRVAPAPEGVPG